jgi:hypothetical protein
MQYRTEHKRCAARSGRESEREEKTFTIIMFSFYQNLWHCQYNSGAERNFAALEGERMGKSNMAFESSFRFHDYYYYNDDERRRRRCVSSHVTIITRRERERGIDSRYSRNVLSIKTSKCVFLCFFLSFYLPHFISLSHAILVMTAKSAF